MKQIELKNKRKAREKHFLREDGTCVAYVYNDNIHYLKNGKYEEIDNTLIIKNGKICNKSNSFLSEFEENSKNGLMCVRKNNHYIKFNLQNSKNAVAQKKLSKSTIIQKIQYNKIFDDIDIEYQVHPSKIKEEIVLKSKNALKSNISFDIETDAKLILLDNGCVEVTFGDDSFTIDLPYMIDSNGVVCKNIFYKLSQNNDKYILSLTLDLDWLKSEDRVYPIYIDPTIIIDQSNNIEDTFIYLNDTNIDRNSLGYLKVGVERINNTDLVHRALIKFNELPEIGTGSSIISASLNLFKYPGLYEYNYLDYKPQCLTIHRITQDWDELYANWNTMNDKFDSRIINWIYGGRSVFGNDLYSEGCNITELVKMWYADTPNYGIMIKDFDETYKNQLIPAFYSKNNTISGDVNPSPYFEIVYKNFNGLENYIECLTRSFGGGKYYANLFNGNLTLSMDILSTSDEKLPATLKLFYNTNDVVLNNDYGYGKGYKFNYNQFIKEIRDGDNVLYLEYCDVDGTLHYYNCYRQYIDEYGDLQEEDEENVFYDEDGLNHTIRKNGNEYILSDKCKNKMFFSKIGDIWLLYRICDSKNNEINIFYNNNNNISKIVDSGNNEINISYSANTIVLSESFKSVSLNYSDNLITSIVSNDKTITLSYNTNECINNITDINGMNYSFLYYEENPYRLKKISTFGLNNATGDSICMDYGYNLTTITEDNDKISTYVFKSNGTLSSVTDMKNDSELDDAYGLNILYGDFGQYNNKLLYEQNSCKWVNNLLNDTSFETSVSGFYSNSNISITNSTEESYSGKKSLKMTNSESGEVCKSISVKKGKKYTFSAYFENNKKIMLKLDTGNGIIEERIIYPHTEFCRNQLTIDYPNDGINDYGSLLIKICFSEENTTVYMDDMQLEEGEVANFYNMVENSDFSDGLSNWSVSGYNPETEQFDNNVGQVVSISNDKTALCIHMNPKLNTSFSKSFPISGNSGDKYNLSFWYKNEGIDCFSSDGIGDQTNNIMVSFDYVNSNYGQQEFPSNSLNSNVNEWQFFNCIFEAANDYTGITLVGWQNKNANNLYITNISLSREVAHENSEYDIYGNLVKTYGYDDDELEIKYDENDHLVKTINDLGYSEKFEYDNDYISRMLMGISQDGTSSQKIYNSQDFPTIKKLSNYKLNEEIVDGLYQIRLKGTNKYLRNISNNLQMKDKNHFADLWHICKIDNYYKISHSIINNLYLTLVDNRIILSNYDADNSLFMLEPNDNGSYTLRNKMNNMLVDFKNNLSCLTSLKDSYEYEVYFENINNKMFFENSYKYDVANNLSETTDGILNRLSYKYENDFNHISEIKDTKNNRLNFKYNQSGQMIQKKYNKKAINFNYNSNNNIKDIIIGNRQYSILYDSFFNISQISMDNNILVSNNYNQQTGKLVSQTFGNNDIITNNYDCFGRIKDTETMDEHYYFKYGKNGKLLKIQSSNYEIVYDYDISDRLSQIFYGNSNIEYKYDKESNLIRKTFYNNYENLSINNLISSNNKIASSNFAYHYNNLSCSGDFGYEYDYLGRIIRKVYDSQLAIEYDYLKLGNRTSNYISKMRINNNEYRYSYDKLNNLTHIYYNNNLINKYKYNKYSELISEYDYKNNILNKYQYDSYGNLLLKTTYNITNHHLINVNSYKYESNELKDQLTGYNLLNLSYDEVGNMTSFGNKYFEWTNGNQLSKFLNNNLIISFKYNSEGIRISKTSNLGEEINYILEDNKIINEEHLSYSITYIYNNIDNLVGFIYNDGSSIQKYYYLKNGQSDVIGIVNSNFDVVAKYEYDAWGNIISIVDGNGNDIRQNYSHIANINPFRYRSYYYDKETNLYYLNSRYYSPELCRFISCDITLSDDALGNNLYVYCGNCPSSRLDINGDFWVELFIIVFNVGSSFVINGLENRKNNQPFFDGWQSSLAEGAWSSAVSLIAPEMNPLLSAFISNAGSEVFEYTSGAGNRQKHLDKDFVDSAESIIINSFVDFGTDKLVDVALPKAKSYNKVTSATKKKIISNSTKTTVSNLTHAATQYYIDNSVYPNPGPYQCPITPPIKVEVKQSPVSPVKNNSGTYNPFRTNSSSPAFNMGTSFMPSSYR